MEAAGTQQFLIEHVRQLEAEVAELKREEAAPLTDTLAHWLAVQLLVAAKSAAQEAGSGCIDMKTLRALNADLVALRHGDHGAVRLKLERERLDLEIEEFKSQSRAKIDAGLDALADEIKHDPRAMAIYKQLKEHLAKDAPKATDSLPAPEKKRGLSPEVLRQIEEEAKLL